MHWSFRLRLVSHRCHPFHRQSLRLFPFTEHRERVVQRNHKQKLIIANTVKQMERRNWMAAMRNQFPFDLWVAGIYCSFPVMCLTAGYASCAAAHWMSLTQLVGRSAIMLLSASLLIGAAITIYAMCQRFRMTNESKYLHSAIGAGLIAGLWLNAVVFPHLGLAAVLTIGCELIILKAFRTDQSSCGRDP